MPAHSSERGNSDSEGAAKVVTNRKHRTCTHLATDRNCDVCLRTKNTRVPCRRRDEGSFPRAVKFGDLITAYDKILNEGCESRSNHRHAVVVQDLASQNQNFAGDGEESTKVSRAVAEAKSSLHRQFIGIWQAL